MKRLLIHELVHAYDYFNNRCDMSTCEGLAYTEVRAAKQGNCPGYYPMEWLEYKCIRDQAIASTAVFFDEDQAKVCVDNVFKQASRDKLP